MSEKKNPAFTAGLFFAAFTDYYANKKSLGNLLTFAVRRLYKNFPFILFFLYLFSNAAIFRYHLRANLFFMRIFRE